MSSAGGSYVGKSRLNKAPSVCSKKSEKPNEKKSKIGRFNEEFETGSRASVKTSQSKKPLQGAGNKEDMKVYYPPGHPKYQDPNTVQSADS